MSARRKLKIIRFPKPKVDPDGVFIKTLVWVLDQARQGNVRGYAMVYVVEGEDGQRTIEAAKSFEGLDRHHVLGAIRKMEANYMRREWPDADSEDGA